jgi:SAM-dependent methyltransferase
MIATTRNYLQQGLRYLSQAQPTIWQLPNPLKIFEFRALTNGMAIGPGSRVVEVGSGRGIAARLLARHGCRVVGVDPNEKQNGIARRDLRYTTVRSRVSFVLGTVDDVREADGLFDAAFSISVLEHIGPLDRTLARLRDLLKPGAPFYLSVDTLANVTDSTLVEQHRRAYSVERYFTRESLGDALERAGFEVEALDDLLRSPLAVDLLETYIRTGNPYPAPAARRAGYHQLEAAERGLTGPGLMLACRARRR